MSTIHKGGPDGSALSRAVPLDPAVFARDYWGRRPLFTRAADLERDSTDLLDRDDVDDLVADRALRTPFARMAKEGTVLAASAFTGSGGFGAEIGDQLDSRKVLAEFAAGATLVLQGLHRTWPPLARFARQLAAELGHPVQINAYITPASARGFDPHYDVHDVFVLQVHGEKHWTIHEPVHMDPLRDQPWTDHRDAVAARARETPAIDETFRPGDALYLPRGWIHSAVALGGTSIHLTVGVAAYTRQDLVTRLVDRVAASAELRSALPMAWQAAELGDELDATIDALVAVLESARRDPSALDAIASGLERRRARDIPADPVRPLATVDAMTSLGADDVVRRRPGLLIRLDGGPERVRIVLPDRSISLPAAARAAVERLLSGEPIRVGDLPELDVDSAAVVVRRLLGEGVLVP
ncbi:MAG TPA: cupin domain-containing protein [Pseudolysinimonas sp.]|nr:cupin domain-containing protein [Pseudolysinimonas sp.]